MARLATLSTTLDPEIKKAVSQYCKRRGLKLRFVVEQALLEQLEDEIDLEAYRLRKNEETVPLEQVIEEFQRRAKRSGR